ncbi:MAG: universal stress protein [Micavibrio sp.]
MENFIGPKIILVPYSGHVRDQAALDYAFNLAEMFDAHVDGWHIAPNPENIIMPYAAYGALPVYPETNIRETEKTNEENRKAAEAKFSIAAKKMKMDKSSFHSAIGRAEDIIAVRGRVADLIVMPRTDENVSYTNAVEGALFGSGRPVLLVPPGKEVKKFNGKVLIAWNGSREAAHAVAFSLPYLTHNKVSILTDQEGKEFPLSADDLKTYLKHQDIQAEIVTYMDEGSPLGAAILNTAKMIDADMIVMGAWSHSRIREYILGGVTDYMLHNADLPVFMAH